ncbi:Lactosylceramide 13-N-acetyl-beta-D-glucosaminyltransferase [Dissostichus eleginoides]|uniref:Hexosyltransferase n=1 Tax=Dissostichus eleginoides TaxID=100907 RepID=A0AAD9BRG6_DISEL|nr:Lactosylceramide 13-N-acetyl-beta-D-glucosaminyltransferase [Dissostichus eleginoides]
MFMNFRRIHNWEELDHHVVSHMRSYTYRYLVNSYDFLNSNFNIKSNRHRKDGSTNVLVTYPYLINRPGKYARGDGKSGNDVLLLLFVKSSPENFERRQAIRDTWGNESFVWSELGATVRMVFALGVDAKRRSRVQRALLQEDQTYGDLIQQDFWIPSTTSQPN